MRNFIEFWRRIFISKKSYYLDGVTWPKTNKMSTISLKLQARPRTAPSTRDRKIGRLSRSDSQISLTSSIGTGRDSRTIGPSSGWILQLKGPWIPEKDRIVARSRHKTRIYRLHRIVRQVPTRRWVRIKFYGTFVDQSFRYAIEIASFWVGFIFDKSSGFVMSRVGSKVDGRRTGIKILFLLFESSAFVDRPVWHLWSVRFHGPLTWSKWTIMWENGVRKILWTGSKLPRKFSVDKCSINVELNFK